MKYLFRFLKGTHQGHVCPLAFTISEQATPGKLQVESARGQSETSLEPTSWNSQARPEC